MFKFAAGIAVGVPAGCLLMGKAPVSIWKDGKWVEWSHKADALIAKNLGRPRQHFAEGGSVDMKNVTIEDILGGRF